MPNAKSWSGNHTSEISLQDENYQKIYDFAGSYSRIYIFGDGKIGMALANYMQNAQIPYAGHITSASLGALPKESGNGGLGVILGIGDEYYPEILPMLRERVSDDDLLFLPAAFKHGLRFQSPTAVREFFHLIVFTTTKCNLHCKSCSTFAPVLQPDFYDYAQFEADLHAFRELGMPRINVLKFTGGEPFLHENLFEMFAHARKLFPKLPLECYTNGALLADMSDERLRLLDALGVVPVITEYPPLLGRLDAFYKRADALGLQYNVIYAKDQKYFSKRPLSLVKSAPPHLYAACPRYKFSSVFLYKGKLYKCVYCMLAGDFNRAFHTNLTLEAGDYLDVASTDKEEIYRFIVSRKPFCGYCQPITQLVPWALSQRSIKEWT